MRADRRSCGNRAAAGWGKQQCDERNQDRDRKQEQGRFGPGNQCFSVAVTVGLYSPELRSHRGREKIRAPRNKLFAVREYEIDRANLVPGHGYRLFPRLGFGEDRTLHRMFGQHIVCLLFTCQAPAFMPGHNLIRSRRDIGELKAAAFVGDGIVGMRNHHHFRVHPDVAAIAPQVHQSRRWHGSRGGPVGEREGQVESGGSVHVDGMQSRVGTHHRQRSVLRNQKNVRYVMATFLVEMTPLFRQIHRFAAGDVLQVNDRIGDAALGPDDQALQVRRLSGVRIADLRIFVDWEGKCARNCS